MFMGPLVTIDIGSYAIKIAEFTGAGRRTLLTAGIRVLPPGVIVSGNIQDPLTVELALVNLLKQMHVRRVFRRAALSMSGSNVMVKRAKMVRNENVDSGDQIFLEAERQFQMDMNELYFDHFDETQDPEAEQIALLVATKRETLDQRMSIITNAGLNIGIVDCEAFALTNLLEYNYGKIEGLVSLINVGASSANVVFLVDGHYIYSREIGIGGEHYTKAIAEALSSTIEIAEDHKIQISLHRIELLPEIEKTILSVHETFISEFQLSADFFFQSGEAPVGNDQVKGIFLTGGGSQVLGLADFIREKLQVPVEIVDPFMNMEVPSRVKGIDNLVFKPMFTVCAGLGLRSTKEVKS